MYTVHQHWDPLKVCIVGKSYPPEFYSFITNSRVRTVMERIAQETEEDYQKLIILLESFGVEVLRPEIKSNDYRDYLDDEGKIVPPPMTPRDYTASIGNNFYMDIQVPGPGHATEDFIKTDDYKKRYCFYENIINQIKNKYSNIITGQGINTAMISRIGIDLYFGTDGGDQREKEWQDLNFLLNRYKQMFPDYRCSIVETNGHGDATYCPVTPGLIISLCDIPTYVDTFPGWEIVYLPGQSWSRVQSFLRLKQKNKGKWWVPGEELNNEFTEFVESWLTHWVGYVEETVFDVNMLVIDERNVVCNNYNEQVFDALARHGVTPHVINFRHRYFWDGGLHCITADLHRLGTQKDYFPERA
jgi:hypothetical protein